MFIYKIGIITLHKNEFDYKSGVPFLLPFLLFQMGHLVVVVNSSHPGGGALQLHLYGWPKNRPILRLFAIEIG